MAAQPTKGGFALYRVSHQAYPPSVLPTGGVPRGSHEDALDTACGGCLGDPTAWIRPPKNYQREALVPAATTTATATAAAAAARAAEAEGHDDHQGDDDQCCDDQHPGLVHLDHPPSCRFLGQSLLPRPEDGVAVASDWDAWPER